LIDWLIDWLIDLWIRQICVYVNQVILEIKEGLKGNQSYIQKLCDLLYFGIWINFF
jgi:hypothetical protein